MTALEFALASAVVVVVAPAVIALAFLLRRRSIPTGHHPAAHLHRT